MREEQGGQDRSVVSHDTIGSIMLRIFEKTKKFRVPYVYFNIQRIRFFIIFFLLTITTVQNIRYGVRAYDGRDNRYIN